MTTEYLNPFKKIISSEIQFYELLDILKSEGKLYNKGITPFSIWVVNKEKCF